MDGSGGHIDTRQILPCVKKEISSEVWCKLNFIQFQAIIELKLNWSEIDVNSSIFLTHCNYLLLWHYNWHQKHPHQHDPKPKKFQLWRKFLIQYALSQTSQLIFWPAASRFVIHFVLHLTLRLCLCLTLITCVLHLAHCPRCKRTRRAACPWSPRRRWRGTPSCTPPPSPPPPASPPSALSHRLLEAL